MVQILLALLLIPVFSFFIKFNNEDKDANLRLSIFFFCLFFLISGLRHVEIANDSFAYASSFKDLVIINSFWSLEGRFEEGFQYLSKFIKIFISDDITIYFILTSLIIQGFFARFIYKNSKIIWLSFFLFVTFRFYFFSVSAMRQGIALVICLYAYEFLKKEKYKYYIFFTLIAISFHYSAFIFLLFPILGKIKPSLRNILLTGVIVIIIFSLLGFIIDLFESISTYGKDYIDQGLSNEYSNRLGAVFIALFSFLMFLFVYKSKYLKTNKDNRIIRYELWGVYVSFLIGILAIQFGILIRFYYYFGVFSIIMIPNVISYYKGREKIKLAILFWSIISLAFIMIILYNKPEWYNFYPYKFFWE